MSQGRSAHSPPLESWPDAERQLVHFDQAWQSPTPPRIEDFLLGQAVADPARRQLLTELVKIDLEYRSRAGMCLSSMDMTAADRPKRAGPRLEDYVQRYPELGPLDQLPVDVIGEEYWVRHCWGDSPRHDEYLAHFAAQQPQLQDRLRQIDADLALERGGERPIIDTSHKAAALLGCSADLPKPVPLTISVAQLTECLRQYRLLSAAQLEELAHDLQRHCADARALAKELLQRGWLTAYQVNQLLQGHGADLLLGPYVMMERLGEGGTGQVFKARHQAMNRIVALKLIRKELVADVDVVNRFYREIQLISQFTHPHVVHAYDAGPLGGTHYLVMEFVEGITLDRLVKQCGPLPVAQACDYIRQAALGLQHAHERGLVHRDLKPSNLLASGGVVSVGASTDDTCHSPLAAHQVVKILDLGLARFRKSTDGELTSTMTPSGPVTMGTPDYMAPEQALDFHGVDTRADIYSLGCTFYYLLTGQPPFSGGTLAQKLLGHQQVEPPAVQGLRADVPASVAAVLRKMLAKEPAHRFQRARGSCLRAGLGVGPESWPSCHANNRGFPWPGVWQFTNTERARRFRGLARAASL